MHALAIDVGSSSVRAALYDQQGGLVPGSLAQIDIELDLEFVPEAAFGTEADLELGADDMKLDALPGKTIDLSEIAREQILLDLPQQFFCRPDCRGLCAKCGTNWNLQSCDCEETEIDPRWAALKNLN